MSHWTALDSRQGQVQAREYQLLSLEQAKKENTIISIPTGGGKTLIAVLAIDHFLNAAPERRATAMFAVPTVVLVSQQAQYCRDKSQKQLRVQELSGTEMDGWTEQCWRDCTRDCDVLVGTPEIFRKALVDHGYISPLDFAIIVFDECHNAVGNSPMAAIMRDAVWPVARNPDCPRILGLTASFINGSLKNIETKRQKLETLMQSRLFCPDVPQWALAGGSTTGTASSNADAEDRFRKVNFINNIPPDAVEFVREKLNMLTSTFEQAFGVPIKHFEKVVRHSAHVLEELGMTAFLFSLRESVIPQLQSHAENLMGLGREDSSASARRLQHGLPAMRAHLQAAADDLQSCDRLTAQPFVSSKAEELLRLLGQLFRGHQEDASYRGIVFVQQVALSVPLAHLVNQHKAGDFSVVSVRAGAVSGVGSMTEAQRSDQMEKFRTGHLNVLICTQALEEGIDVSDCTFVIRFNHFDTTKSHIQGSGRARRHDAVIYYFENQPAIEQMGARLLTDVAKNHELALTAQQRNERRVDEMRSVEGIYPFMPAAGRGSQEVNFFNALEIVYRYCSQTMGQSIQPEALFTYRREVVREYPREEIRLPITVQIPSPRGFMALHLEEANEHWGEVRLEDVLPADRIKNMSPEDQAKRRLLYVAAIYMHRQGLLTETNEPSEEARRDTKLACPALPLAPGIQLKDAYPRNVLAHDAPPPPAPGASTHVGGRSHQTNGQARPLTHGPAAAPRSSAQGFAALPLRPGGALSTGSAYPAGSSTSFGAGSAPAAAAAAARGEEGGVWRGTSIHRCSASAGEGELSSGKNFKGILQEWVQQRWRGPLEQVLRYDPPAAASQAGGMPQGFISTLHLLQLPPEHQAIRGEVQSSKKMAEQSAAKNALMWLATG